MVTKYITTRAPELRQHPHVETGNHMPQHIENVFCDLYSPGEGGIKVVQLYLMPAFFLAVLIMGLPLNLLSLWIFFHRLKRWTRSSVLLFNLAMADTSWLLALPFLIHYHLNGLSLCKTLRLLYHNYLYLSIFFVTCVSVDRYLAIVHPLRSVVLLSRRQTYLLCAAGWSVNMILSLPLVTMTYVENCPGKSELTVCTLYTFLNDTDESLPYSICSTCIGFLCPLSFICYCYVCSIRELRRRSRRPQLHLNSSRARSLRLTRVLTTVLILFVLFYLPYHLLRNASIVMRALYPDRPASWRPLDLAFSLEMCLCSLNMCVNALFSCFVGQQFRKEVQDTFRLTWLWQGSRGRRLTAVRGLFKRQRIQRVGGLAGLGQAVTPL